MSKNLSPIQTSALIEYIESENSLTFLLPKLTLGEYVILKKEIEFYHTFCQNTFQDEQEFDYDDSRGFQLINLDAPRDQYEEEVVYDYHRDTFGIEQVSTLKNIITQKFESGVQFGLGQKLLPMIEHLMFTGKFFKSDLDTEQPIPNWKDEPIPDVDIANLVAEEGDIELLQQIEQLGVLPNSYGLEKAILKNHVQVVEWLKEKGVPKLF